MTTPCVVPHGASHMLGKVRCVARSEGWGVRRATGRLFTVAAVDRIVRKRTPNPKLCQPPNVRHSLRRPARDCIRSTSWARRFIRQVSSWSIMGGAHGSQMPIPRSLPHGAVELALGVQRRGREEREGAQRPGEKSWCEVGLLWGYLYSILRSWAVQSGWSGRSAKTR